MNKRKIAVVTISILTLVIVFSVLSNFIFSTRESGVWTDDVPGGLGKDDFACKCWGVEEMTKESFSTFYTCHGVVYNCKYQGQDDYKLIELLREKSIKFLSY